VFQGGVVRTATQVANCQAIRFHVYCRERRFLAESSYPDGSEQDEFDEHAMHLAVLQNCGKVLATARIVRASHLGFPLERYCTAEIPRALLDTTGEVSRLAVPRSTAPDRWTSRWTREIALKLYQTTYRTAKNLGLTHLLAVMELSLVRILRRFDIPWIAIGPTVEYAGAVRPYLLSLEEFDSIDSDAAKRFRDFDEVSFLPSTPEAEANRTAVAAMLSAIETGLGLRHEIVAHGAGERCASSASISSPAIVAPGARGKLATR
jgi:N-acyl-L-homoserine lactone synthetase